ncbi:phosphoadenosine phosphosulfate reductase [Pseudogemmobacter bohemicus]|uniref:phosphoadenosine phosphosulfate reductase n=1 Tax=Pseudogemmobacter bohemicus TaxID=2250708 RepID=UPI000DD33CD4|nr:phosphoadenosine phosphosulfate reductase [Pseudogemmobacter bohemicus]
MPFPDGADTLPAHPGNEWLAAMDIIADEDGYLDPLGPDHWAFFAETGTTLLVTFERAEQIQAASDTMPGSWALAQSNGWSSLCLIARGETFWRAPEVWGYFDRLVDDAFFDDFDQVLFYGSGAAGYAAASYVVAAPGARALLLSPRATLVPDIAGWDRRHLPQRRLDFTSRYGYAPDMTEGAGQVWLVHDPLSPTDNAHAALFRRSWTTMLHSRWGGEQPERTMPPGMLDQLITGAMDGTLSPEGFAALWRGRRRSPAWVRNLLGAIASKGNRHRQIAVLRQVLAEHPIPRFERRLAALLAQADAPMPEKPAED